MKKIVIALAVALAFALTANAQPYKNSVGVVFSPDYTSGTDHLASFQWKHFINEKNNIDILAGYQFNWGPHASAIFEWCLPIGGDDHFNFFVGPGVHAGIVNDYNGFGDSCVSFGITGAVDIEYMFKKVPIAISVDWHPYLTWQPAIDDLANFGWKDTGIGVKYYF